MKDAESHAPATNLDSSKTGEVRLLAFSQSMVATANRGKLATLGNRLVRDEEVAGSNPATPTDT